MGLCKKLNTKVPQISAFIIRLRKVRSRAGIVFKCEKFNDCGILDESVVSSA
jgi:hypothetical protein